MRRHTLLALLLVRRCHSTIELTCFALKLSCRHRSIAALPLCTSYSGRCLLPPPQYWFTQQGSRRTYYSQYHSARVARKHHPAASPTLTTEAAVGRTRSIVMASSSSSARRPSQSPVSIHWFRKGLRLHDNLALMEACNGAESLYPLFVMDSDPASPESRAGSLR